MVAQNCNLDVLSQNFILAALPDFPRQGLPQSKPLHIREEGKGRWTPHLRALLGPRVLNQGTTTWLLAYPPPGVRAAAPFGPPRQAPPWLLFQPQTWRPCLMGAWSGLLGASSPAPLLLSDLLYPDESRITI